MTELDKDFTANSIGEPFKQCIAHMKVSAIEYTMPGCCKPEAGAGVWPALARCMA